MEKKKNYTQQIKTICSDSPVYPFIESISQFYHFSHYIIKQKNFTLHNADFIFKIHYKVKSILIKF